MDIDIIDLNKFAPTLAPNYDMEENELNKIYIEYNQRSEIFKEHMNIEKKYFFDYLHDSKILSCKKMNNDLCIRLNDRSTVEFAWTLINKKKLRNNISRMIFPLEIKSYGTKYLSSNLVDENGMLYKSKILKMKDYLYEEIISWNNEEVEIVFALWSRKLRKLKKSGYVLILKCEKILITEYQHKYWNKYFGEEYNKYYYSFLNERNKGAFLLDNSFSDKIIDRIDAENV